MIYTKKTDLKIYETNNYDKFIYLKENRKITENKVLERVIKSHNKLKYNPTIVSNNYQVLDGQHRLEIAKKLGLSIYYIIDEHAEIDTLQKLNIGNKNWTQKDHLEFYAQRNYETYEFIKHTLTGVKMSLTSFLVLFVNGRFKEGEAKLNKTNHEIIYVMQQYQEIVDKFMHYSPKKYMSKKMQTQICYLIFNPNYDHKRMLQAIDNYPDAIIKANTYNTAEMIKYVLVEELYNYKRRNKL